MKRFYYSAPAKVTECHDCGETRMCEVVVSDPEPETGYVDEYALCEACENGDTKREDPMGWLRKGDQTCACGHNRSQHFEEQPYECFAETSDDCICYCEGFEYPVGERSATTK